MARILGGRRTLLTKKKQVKFDESIESSIYEQETDGKPSIQYDDIIKTKEISSKPIQVE